MRSIRAENCEGCELYEYNLDLEEENENLAEKNRELVQIIKEERATRLIDADALIKRLKEDWPQTSKTSWAQIVAKCAPTIDAEPVVHCKDCKHNPKGIGWVSCPMTGANTRKSNDFCSYGERKEP